MAVPVVVSSQNQRFVADACALLAYLRNESGALDVENVLVDSKSVVSAHALNVCEVYYAVLRESGENKARGAVDILYGDGVVVFEDMDEPFWIDVGGLKVNPGQVSLADCVAIALARRLNCELLTADHHEMDKLVGTGIVDIRFIR